MSFEHTIQRIMSGQATGVFPSLGRCGLAAIEPFYRAAVSWRNRGFDRNPLRIRRLPKPVISIGNLTTGGTGKTPVIRWLATRLRERGFGVAILSRGYKSPPGTLGDEQRMLLSLLGNSAGTAGATTRPPIVIECDPDRYAAGERALQREPGIDVFLLDDGFQHRRLHRDLDIVLLHAAEPFGYRHVLPRGLLREPIAGIERAQAVIITNVTVAKDNKDAPADQLEQSHSITIAEVRRWNASCPILFERHEPSGLRTSVVASDEPPDQALAALSEQLAYCFSGLGSPDGFEAQIRSIAGRYTGEHRFPDHHDYSAADLIFLRAQATKHGANVLVTTEKDWVKLAELPEAKQGDPPIWRLDVEAKFDAQQETALLATVIASIGKEREKW
jgi:tetraacyldisaccharide 4'-kinase